MAGLRARTCWRQPGAMADDLACGDPPDSGRRVGAVTGLAGRAGLTPACRAVVGLARLDGGQRGPDCGGAAGATRTRVAATRPVDVLSRKTSLDHV